MADRLAGRRGLVLGVSNRRSLAWSIASRLAGEGMDLAFTYRRERFADTVKELAGSIGSELVFQCDVVQDAQISSTVEKVGDAFGGVLDVLVHSIAFADAEDLSGRLIDTPPDRFWTALNISAYSLIRCCRAVEPLMKRAGGGSVITLTYIGGERVVSGYNVMGIAKAALDSAVQYLAYDLGPSNIRINSISAGPVSTLASRGIPTFRSLESATQERAALERGITGDEVGAAAAFLASDDSASITATRLYVDAGYHASGL